MIFDGHGPAGHDCAAFAKGALESVAAEILEQNPDVAVDALLVEANEVTNRLMHDAVDTSESGTTAVNLIVLGSTLYCSNVGDSRRILGRRVDGKVAPAPPAAARHEGGSFQIHFTATGLDARSIRRKDAPFDDAPRDGPSPKTSGKRPREAFFFLLVGNTFRRPG